LHIKRTVPKGRSFFAFSILLSLAEAFAAINRTIFAGLEGNLAGVAALGANRIVHLAGAADTAGSFTCVSACLAALRLVGKALLGEEFLLAGREYEFASTFLTGESFVFEH